MRTPPFALKARPRRVARLNPLRLSALLLPMLLFACDDGGDEVIKDAHLNPSGRDAAPQVDPRLDTGVTPDVVVEPDATVVEPDATVVEPDSTVVEPDSTVVEPDAAVIEPDSTVVEPDSAVVEPDSTVIEPDAAELDAEVIEPDAAVELDAEVIEPDAAPPECVDEPLNLLDNGGFEAWEEGTPVGFMGAESNLYGYEQGPARCGAHALRMMNEEERHARFTNVAIPARFGRYTLTYWARGVGEIRNAFHDGDFSSYSGYTTLLGGEWRQISYSFNLAADTEALEVIFSVRLTEPGQGDLLIDDAVLLREDEPCDAVECPEWAECARATGECVPRSGFCGDDADCADYMACGEDHICAPRPGRCTATADCSGETPVCDTEAHQCVAGDPCADVSCDEWEVCDPDTATCQLGEDRCYRSVDCARALPACDVANHQCVEADHAVNVIPNGGFERWDTYELAYYGEQWLPEGWYGVDFGGDNTGDTEIHPRDVNEGLAHTGALGLQLIGGDVADRFTSEGFDVPAGAYTCAYWVRGQGFINQRSYSSAGWHPQTDRIEINSQEWRQILFDIRGGSRGMRIIFYASRTEGEHINIDDVVCTRIVN